MKGKTMNFYQFYNKLNGTPYEKDIPAPVKYDLDDYASQITKGQVNNVDSIDGNQKGTWELTPLTADDFQRAGAEETADWYAKHGKKRLLGPPLDDEGMKKYRGGY